MDCYQWIRKFSYPHCKKIASFGDLRSGVALAEILSEILPSTLHYLFLGDIEICNLTQQACLGNLRTILKTIDLCYMNQPDHMVLKSKFRVFSAEGLYFEKGSLEKFVRVVFMEIQRVGACGDVVGGSYRKFVDSGCEREEKVVEKVVEGRSRKEERRDVMNVSDIANLSSIMVHEVAKQEPQHVHKQEVPQFDETEYPLQKQASLKTQILEHHHLRFDSQTPHKYLGQLINSIFSSSRLNPSSKIIKPSHYESGEMMVYRKIGDFLINCERLNKSNVCEFNGDVQKGVIREVVFWGVVEDLLALARNKNKGVRRNASSREKMRTLEDDEHKQNIVYNQQQSQPLKKKTKKGLAQPLEYPSSTIKSIQKWITNDLGYEHSLNKSKTIQSILQNPLLNGVLLGSIVMRLQIGKVNIIKYPQKNMEVRRNMEEIGNALIKRSYQGGRKFLSYEGSYQCYLGILAEIREEYDKKCRSEKQILHRINKKKQQGLDLLHLTQTQKQSLNKWLQFQSLPLATYPSLPSTKLSELTTEFLNIKLYRQTTSKIKLSNMKKILEELREIGYNEALQIKAEDLVDEEEGEEMRWVVVGFLRDIVDRVGYA